MKQKTLSGVSVYGTGFWSDSELDMDIQFAKLMVKGLSSGLCRENGYIVWTCRKRCIRKFASLGVTGVIQLQVDCQYQNMDFAPCCVHRWAVLYDCVACSINVSGGSQCAIARTGSMPFATSASTPNQQCEQETISISNDLWPVGRPRKFWLQWLG